MGMHGFDSLPVHLEGYKSSPVFDSSQIFGADRQWNMVATRQQADLADGMYFAGVDHFVLTVHLAGGTARRLDLPNQPMAETGAISLQVPGSGGAFATRGGVEYAHFYFKQSLIDEVVEDIRYGGQPVPDIYDFFGMTCPRLYQRLQIFLEKGARTGRSPSTIEMDSEGYLAILSLLQDGLRVAPPDECKAQVSFRREVSGAIEFMEEFISLNIGLTEVAGAAGLSPFHFLRVFKAETGETPSAFLMRRRVERASALIQSSSMPLAEVAHSTGFSNQAHMRWSRLLGQFGG